MGAEIIWWHKVRGADLESLLMYSYRQGQKGTHQYGRGDTNTGKHQIRNLSFPDQTLPWACKVEQFDDLWQRFMYYHGPLHIPIAWDLWWGVSVANNVAVSAAILPDGRESEKQGVCVWCGGWG